MKKILKIILTLLSFTLLTVKPAQAGFNPDSSGTLSNNLVSYWNLDESSGTTLSDIKDSNPGTAKSSINDNLVSWWKLDDTSNPITDSKGTNNGTATGTTYVAGGRVGGARNFNNTVGSSDRVTAPVIATTGDYTFSAWVRWAAVNSSTYKIIFWNTSSTNAGWGVMANITNNYICGVHNDAAGNHLYCSTTTLDAGSWNHIVAVRSGNSLTLYKNNSVIYSNASTLAPVTPTGNSFLGNSSTLNQNFNGDIDEAAVWNRALTAGEVSYLYNSYSGRTYDPNPPGPIPSGAPPNSKITNARAFSGADYIQVPNSANLQLATVSFAAWFNTGGIAPSLGNAFTILGKDTQSGGRYSWGVQLPNFVAGQAGNAQAWFFAPTCSTTPTSSGLNLTNNAWHFVAVVISGSTLSMYIDGNTTPITGTITCALGAPTGEMNTGAWPPNTSAGRTSFFIGKIDEVGIWNTALIVQQITDLYNGGNGNTYSLPNPPPVTTNTTISPPTVSANGTTQYTITATATDNSGGTDINAQYVITNYQGTDAGAYRGELGWSTSSTFPNWGNPPYATGPTAATSGGGYCGKISAYGASWINLISCNTSITGGTTRTTNFIVTFPTILVAPTANNTLSTWVQDTASQTDGWDAYSTFGLSQTACISSGTSALPTLYPPTGLVSWWRADESSGNTVSDSTWGNDGTARSSVNNNLLSWWKMDESSGTTVVADSAGTANGTSASSTNVGPGILSSNARTFNGTSDNISISGSSNLSFEYTQPFSFSAWVKTTQSGVYRNIIYKVLNASSPAGYMFRIDSFSNSLGLSLVKASGNYLWAGASQAINDGTWHHVVATYDGSGTFAGIKLYIDGAAKATTNYSAGTIGTILNSANVNIGGIRSGTTDAYFQGTIDEVGAWNRVLTPSEISYLFNSYSGRTYDPNAGPTITTGATSSFNPSLPALGSARNFNGNTDYISVSDNSSLNPTGDYTITAWVKSSSTATEQEIASKFTTGGSNPGYLLSLGNGVTGNTGKLAMWVGDSTGGWAVANTAINNGGWHHVAGVLSGTTVKLYVDGNLDNSPGVTRSPNRTTTQPLSIGRRYDTGAYFPGTIDEVQFSNSALSASQILAEFQRTAVSGTCSTCSATGCGSGTQSCLDSFCTSFSQACQGSGNTSINGSVVSPPSATTVCASTYCSASTISTYTISGVLGNTNYTVQPTLAGSTPTSAGVTTTCGPTPGPTFWWISDAGVVNSASTINAGSGTISQGGSPTPPGFNLTNYTNLAPTTNISYNYLKSAVLKNSGILSDATAHDTCATFGTTGKAATFTNSFGQSFDLFCYTGGVNFDSQLNAAISYASANIAILYPLNTADPQTISTVKTLPASPTVKNIVVLVPSSLTVTQNVSVPTTNYSAGLIFVLNNPNTTDGNVLVNSTVGSLDGLYIFPGTFNDNADGAANPNLLLNGYGSLIGTGTTPWTLGRTVPVGSGPGEQWTYQPKYITIFNSVLSSAKYTWQELPPQ